jgi:hypothetical protein
MLNMLNFPYLLGWRIALPPGQCVTGHLLPPGHGHTVGRLLAPRHGHTGRLLPPHQVLIHRVLSPRRHFTVFLLSPGQGLTLAQPIESVLLLVKCISVRVPPGEGVAGLVLPPWEGVAGLLLLPVIGQVGFVSFIPAVPSRSPTRK